MILAMILYAIPTSPMPYKEKPMFLEFSLSMEKIVSIRGRYHHQVLVMVMRMLLRQGMKQSRQDWKLGEEKCKYITATTTTTTTIISVNRHNQQRQLKKHPLLHRLIIAIVMVH
jgi:hypothetical protein